MTKPPISERRLAANRANAKKSTGPRTAGGKRRVSRNASKHSLYAPGFRLPADIEQRLYVQSLERTADIADPQFRALTVHRLMLRGHQRRLFQLEGKLWAEALRVNGGAVPQAALWIRQHQSSLVQALNRYDAWIGVRIRAVQRASLPYLVGDEKAATETVIPAKAATIYAAAAGSARPIELTRPGSSVPEENRPAKESSRAPMTGLQYLMARNAKAGPVRPASAPQAVRPVRPPRVPGLNLRFLRAKARKTAQQKEVPSGSPSDLKSTAPEGTKPSLGPPAEPTRVPFPRPVGGAHRNPNEVSRKPLHPRRSTADAETKPSLGPIPTPTQVPFPRPLGGPIAIPTKSPGSPFTPTDPPRLQEQSQLQVLYERTYGFHSPAHWAGLIAIPTKSPGSLFTPTDPLHPRKQSQLWVLYGHPQGFHSPAHWAGLIAISTKSPGTLFTPTDPPRPREQSQLQVLYERPHWFHSPAHWAGPVAIPTKSPGSPFTPVDPPRTRKQSQVWVPYRHPHWFHSPAHWAGPGVSTFPHQIVLCLSESRAIAFPANESVHS